MQEHALTSLLPTGTVTWENYDGSACSTVDILLETRVSDACTHCGIHRNDHGSDHKAIRAHFEVATVERDGRPQRRMYDKAD